MVVEITPEPTSEEREALLAALFVLDVTSSPPAWWEAGAREAVGEELEVGGPAED
jgi:hypothetical protein